MLVRVRRVCNRSESKDPDAIGRWCWEVDKALKLPVQLADRYTKLGTQRLHPKLKAELQSKCRLSYV